MAINLDNAQYGKFVQFAQEQMRAGNATAIARDGGEVPGGGPLAGHSIAAATGDKVAPLWRSADNKNANNATRDLFRQTIVDMFDGEANIPASVRNAMKMEDYGQGKPLTARRILAVKTELDRIAAGNAAFNASIARAISDGRMERLPQEMQDGLASVVEHFRDVFGADIVPAGKTIAQIVNAANVASGVKALADAANAQGRPIATADLVGLYDQKASERLAGEVAGRFILAKIKALAPEISGTARSIAAQFEARHPGLQADIAGCANPDEIAAVFHDHEAQIDAFVDLVVRSNAAEKAVEAKATAKLASALGLDGRFVAAHVPTDELRGAARNLTTRIAAGTAPGSKDPGYDVEAAYDALVDAFVQKRLNACAAIDSLDLPADVKNRWKAEYISYHNVPPITPAQLFEVTKVLQGSASALQAILSGGMSPQETAEALDGIARTVNHVIREATGNPRFFDGVGLDEQIPIFGMMLMAAEAKTPALGQAIRNAGAAFLGQIDEYCESYAQSASPFVKALAIRTNAALISSLTDKDKFLAAMEKETGAALAECGVTDAKVCKDVENAMRKIAGDALAGATDLKALSDILATAKAEAAALARTLDGKAREMIAKYAEGLPQETVPILARLVRVLDWRGNAAAASEEIVKNYAEDMKAWRDIASGSPDAKGLQDVLQRRMNGYLKYILAGTRGFNMGDHSGIFQTFLEDLPRCKYAINGKTIRGKTLQEKMVPFLESIKDPAKRKAVSVMINQQMWGDYTASVANRLPFSGWKAGMQDEPIDTVPGIEKFASRDFLKTGYQLFDTGPMEFAIEVAPDESTVTVRTSSAYPMHADISVPAATTGTCTVTQEFVIDFTGAEPAIRDLRIGQALT